MAKAAPARVGEAWRAPTALVLGVLAGVLAAVAILPTVVPLTQRVVAAEHQALLAQTLAAGRAVAVLTERNFALQPGIARRLGVDGVRIIGVDGTQLFADGSTAEAPLAELCPPGEPPGRLIAVAEVRWAVACEHAGTSLVLTARHPEGDATKSLGSLVAALACMVGISTAFGVLQVLSPLSRIRAGLERVVTGERGVLVASTGLAELDELVEGVNRAARAVEDREDAIKGRIQVVQEMARVVAHEIRNPLQSLEFQAGLVVDEDDRTERAILARSIQEEVRVLESVVTRMLAGDGGLRAVRAPVSISALVAGVVTFHRARARHRGIRLESFGEVEAELELDRTLLSRALENLVTNALDYAPEGHGVINVTAYETATGVGIIVEDNGPGVDPKLDETLFQPGVGLKEGGLGLGLALVKGVILAHEGVVTQDRSPLGGARFRIELPRPPPPEE